LRWRFSHATITFAIPKASQISHVEENAGAGTLQLTEAEIGRIDAAFPAGRPRRRNVPML
jgi:diketogulonate reductase-like aldo/keto reductase